MSLYLLILLGVLSGLAWLVTWLKWAWVARWWYQAGDKNFLKRPQFDVGLLFILLMGNTFVLAMVVNRLLSPWAGGDGAANGEATWMSLVTSLVAGLGLLGLWAGLARWLYGTRGFQWGWGPLLAGKWWETFRASVWAFFLLVPIVLLVHAGLSYLIEYRHETLEQFQGLRQSGRWDLVVAIFISTAVWTPIGEEITFRVIIQGFIEQVMRTRSNYLRWLLGPLRAGPAASLGLAAAARQAGQEPTVSGPKPGWGSVSFWAPIVLTSLLFSLAHAGQGAAPISLYLLSLGLGFLYKTTGNVGLCIAIHAYLNGLTLAQALWH